jgi:hypothetical protein
MLFKSYPFRAFRRSPFVSEQQTEHRRDDEEQHVPHGALADLFNRAERIRQAYDDLRVARHEGDADHLQG